jgi:hypothetical protein
MNIMASLCISLVIRRPRRKLNPAVLTMTAATDRPGRYPAEVRHDVLALIQKYVKHADGVRAENAGGGPKREDAVRFGVHSLPASGPIQVARFTGYLRAGQFRSPKL